jgi:hypothetical protein
MIIGSVDGPRVPPPVFLPSQEHREIARSSPTMSRRASDASWPWPLSRMVLGLSRGKSFIDSLGI